MYVGCKIFMKILLTIILTIIVLKGYSQKETVKSNNFSELGCGLYKNNIGDLGFKTKFLLDDMGNRGVGYQTWGYIADENDTISLEGGIIEFKNIIDTSTFQILNEFYCKDKNYVDAIFYTSSGATFNITKKIDPSSFRCIGSSSYGIDKNNIYFRSQVVKYSHIKSFRAIIDNPFGAYDKYNYYNNGEVITLIEARERGYIRRKKIKWLTKLSINMPDTCRSREQYF